MAKIPGWLRSPHSLPLLLGLVVALPAIALVVLGVRLLEQDRALAVQRRGEMAQSAADRVVRALEHEVNSVARQLADPAWMAERPAPGTVRVLISNAGLQVEPPSALAWYPSASHLPEPPAAVFAEAEAAEFQSVDLEMALRLNRGLAVRPDVAIHSGALLRQARVLRKMNRKDEAEAVFAQLGGTNNIAIDGVPVDLIARQAQCALALASGRAGALRGAALALQTDLNAGRWRLDRPTYEFVAERLSRWLGPDARRDIDREAMAAAVEWFALRSGRRRAGDDAPQTATAETRAPTGCRSVQTGSGMAVVIWAGTPDRVAAIVALERFVVREWRPAAERAARPATVVLSAAGDARPASAASGTGVVAGTRPASETGLPWTIVTDVPVHLDLGPLAARERLLLVGLAAVLILVATGGFLVFRWRRQEIALARLQSDFVAAVSHEFRTPLTALSQFNELLEDGDELPAAKRRAYHQAQARATVRLRRLVESVLDFGRMQAGRHPYAFQPVDAGKLVSGVVDQFRAEIDGRGFVVRCEIDAGDHTIAADAEALDRAVWNLLDNAVKYSRDRREVEVTVCAATPARPGSRPEVAVAVRDFGIGIPRLEQARLFQKFVRGAGATAAGIKGTGIGLAMAQHIVAAHGGRILVESEPNVGSTFTIVIERSLS